jgi:hypothetical protein
MRFVTFSCLGCQHGSVSCKSSEEGAVTFGKVRPQAVSVCQY